MVAWAIAAAALLGGLAACWLMHRELVAARRSLSELKQRFDDRQALAECLMLLEKLSDAAPDALFLLDEQHTVVHMNAAARRLFDRADRGLSLIAVTHHYELDRIAAEALRSGEDAGWQVDIGGAQYRIYTQRIEAPQGLHLAMALEDVSELKRLGRARRDMVANISHELRTPISSIRLLVDTLLRGAASAADEREALLHKIAHETHTLQQMAQELLDLSMIESGRAEMILIPVELRLIIQEAIERLCEQARRNHLTLEAQVPPGLKVLADHNLIVRVLTNLLDNAVKFTPTGGVISVSVDLIDDWVCISVTDTGPGIPPEERERVFERFYRRDRARSRGSGTGLGLAIAKHIVEGHGGKIWAEAAPEGSGARISFTLPLA